MMHVFSDESGETRAAMSVYVVVMDGDIVGVFTDRADAIAYTDGYGVVMEEPLVPASAGGVRWRPCEPVVVK